MMTKSNFGRTQFACDTIQNTAAQARAERAGRFALGDETFDDGIRVSRLDVERDV